MAIAELYTGSVSISTTEISLVSGTSTLQNITTDGIYQCFIDVSALAAGDEYIIKIKEKVTSGGSQQEIYASTLEGAQGGPWVSPSLLLMHGWDVTMKQIAGTARTIAWSIRQVA